MPSLVNFETRDIHLLLDFSLEELKKIETALNNCEITAIRPKEKEASKYLKDEFYPYIAEMIERFTNEG